MKKKIKELEERVVRLENSILSELLKLECEPVKSESEPVDLWEGVEYAEFVGSDSIDLKHGVVYPVKIEPKTWSIVIKQSDMWEKTGRTDFLGETWASINHFKPSTKEAFEAQNKPSPLCLEEEEEPNVIDTGWLDAQNKPQQKTLEEYLKPSFENGWVLLANGVIENTNIEYCRFNYIDIYRTKKEALLAQRFLFLRRVAEKCEEYGGGLWIAYLGWDGLNCDKGDTFPYISPVRFHFRTFNQAQHFIDEATRLGLNDWEVFKS